MRLLPFLIAGVILSGCVDEVHRPSLDHICLVDKDIPGCSCSRGEGKEFKLSMEDCDGHKAVSLEDAKKIDIYIIDLQKKILELQKPK